ncbi:hypothetical protein vseg_011060 [Gypsophila vaccaria]
MASDEQKCIVCEHALVSPPTGLLREFTYAKICDSCCFKEGTFCHKYHRGFDGWRKCETCGWKLHYGCIMSENMYDMTEDGLTCYDCLKKKNLPLTVYALNDHRVVFYGKKLEALVQLPPGTSDFSSFASTFQAAPNRGASSSVPNSADGSKVNDSSRSENITGREVLTDLQAASLFNSAPQDLGNAATEGGVETRQLSNSSLTFLFEKRLTKTDCNHGSGCLRLPTQIAERFLPMPPGQQKMPVVVRDADGRIWNLQQRWWRNGNSRKYVIVGMGECFYTMNCKKGDRLKFYRQNPNGELIVERPRNHASTSTR